MQLENVIAKGQIIPLMFFQDAVAASQDAVEMFILEMQDPVSGSAKSLTTEYLIPWPYDVVAISARHSSECTAGALTVDATIDGTATGLQAALDDTTYTQSNYAVQRRNRDQAPANSRVGIKLTTDADWAPVSAGLVVVVWILAYTGGY